MQVLKPEIELISFYSEYPAAITASFHQRALSEFLKDAVI